MSTAKPDLAAYRAELEREWRCWDELLDAVEPNRWSKKYGADWTFADIPYHIAYFDRVMIAEALEAGPDLSESGRWQLRTMRQLNDWNAKEFAKRKPGQTPRESIAEMRAVRERIRAVLARLMNADLTRPAWNHFFDVGWSTTREALAGALQHNWSELIEFRIRMNRKTPEMPPLAEHVALASYVRFFPLFGDRQAMAKAEGFACAMEFSGPTGGAWTIRCVKGTGVVEEGKAADASMVLRMDPETFAKMFKRIQNPMLLMLTGRIKVKGLGKMGQFGKLFPPPKLDEPLLTAGAQITAG